MMLKPNHTNIEGKVRAITPAADGVGHEVDLEVCRNLSDGREDDFLQPAKGEMLQLFASLPPAAVVGDLVNARARVLGGPTGERVILEKIEPVAGDAAAGG